MLPCICLRKRLGVLDRVLLCHLEGHCQDCKREPTIELPDVAAGQCGFSSDTVTPACRITDVVTGLRASKRAC